MKDEGHVQEYPCDCQGDGHTVCWVVRHPKSSPPVSYPTKEEAEMELAKLRQVERSSQKED